jgi:hypothetical protein
VMIPTAAALSAGTPDAMAMPRHNGKATRKTTTDASKSSFHVSRKREAFAQVRLSIFRVLLMCQK